MTYASKYVQQVPLRYAPRLFAQASRSAIGDNWPLWLIAIGGAAFVLRHDPRQPARRFFVVAFGLFFDAVCPARVPLPQSLLHRRVARDFNAGWRCLRFDP